MLDLTAFNGCYSGSVAVAELNKANSGSVGRIRPEQGGPSNPFSPMYLSRTFDLIRVVEQAAAGSGSVMKKWGFLNYRIRERISRVLTGFGKFAVDYAVYDHLKDVARSAQNVNLA
ncbi:LOW QUALITY PROTEIN: hypothetical protein M8C21_031564, partial [Ambrosia artemisiifolia]